MPTTAHPVTGVSFTAGGIAITIPLSCTTPALVHRVLFAALWATMIAMILEALRHGHL
jgi:hypothetical protein